VSGCKWVPERIELFPLYAKSYEWFEKKSTVVGGTGELVNHYHKFAGLTQRYR